MKKYLLTLLAALMLLTAAFAEPVAPTLYVSVSDDQGALVLAYAPVTVIDADGDGTLTIHDALAAAHEAYHPQGAAAYLAENTEWGKSLFCLWGIENGGSYGYMLNDASPMSLLDPVQAGDHVKAYAYTDLSAWSDTYSYFTTPVAAAKVNEAVSLTLSASGYDAAWNPVTLPIAGAALTVNGEKADAVTDEAGLALLTFAAPGVYTISAVSDSMTLVPPVCIVTVTE